MMCSTGMPRTLSASAMSERWHGPMLVGITSELHNPRINILSLEHFHGFLVERNKRLRPQPLPLVGNRAVGEVSTGIEHGQSCLNRRAVGFDVPGNKQRPDGSGRIGSLEAVNTAQYPHELTQAWNRNRNHFSPA